MDRLQIKDKVVSPCQTTTSMFYYYFIVSKHLHVARLKKTCMAKCRRHYTKSLFIALHSLYCILSFPSLKLFEPNLKGTYTIVTKKLGKCEKNLNIAKKSKKGLWNVRWSRHPQSRAIKIYNIAGKNLNLFRSWEYDFYGYVVPRTHTLGKLLIRKRLVEFSF